MTRFFAHIRSFFAKHERDRPAFTQPCFGFSPTSVAHLRDFRDSDAFNVFTEALDIAANLQAEVLLQSRDDATLHETRGVILGLRRAASLVDEILTNDVTRRQRDEQRRAAEHAATEPDTVALFGTPSYRRT